MQWTGPQVPHDVPDSNGPAAGCAIQGPGPRPGGPRWRIFLRFDTLSASVPPLAATTGGTASLMPTVGGRYMCAFPMIFAFAAAFPKASLAFGPLHGFAEELVHKNMHVELSRTAYAYCQCRNVERAWSTPPRICATFRGLPRQAPPRVTISILLTFNQLSLGCERQCVTTQPWPAL